MTYLLDTNAAIALLKEHPQMLHHVRRVGLSALRVCAPVEAELWYGVAKSARQEQNRSRLLTLLAVRTSSLIANDSMSLSSDRQYVQLHHFIQMNFQTKIKLSINSR